MPSIFVAYSYASMDNENALFGSSIIDEPAVTEIATEHDLHELERQILAGFGMPDRYRWVVINNWKWLPNTQDSVFGHSNIGVLTGTIGNTATSVISTVVVS